MGGSRDEEGRRNARTPRHRSKAQREHRKGERGRRVSMLAHMAEGGHSRGVTSWPASHVCCWVCWARIGLRLLLLLLLLGCHAVAAAAGLSSCCQAQAAVKLSRVAGTGVALHPFAAALPASKAQAAARQGGSHARHIVPASTTYAVADRAAATPATSSTMTPCTPMRCWARTHSGSSLGRPYVMTCRGGQRSEDGCEQHVGARAW